jgi:hypothetical protein
MLRSTRAPDRSKFRLAKCELTLDCAHVDRGAVAPAGQKAVLGLAHVRNLDGEPGAGGGQEQREDERGEIDQHAMSVIVIAPAALVFREILDRRSARRRVALARQPSRCAGGRAGPRAEGHDAVGVIGRLSAVTAHGRLIRCIAPPVSAEQRRNASTAMITLSSLYRAATMD